MMNLNKAVAGAVASSLYPEMRFSWEIKVNQLCIQNFFRILYLKEILFQSVDALFCKEDTILREPREPREPPKPSLQPTLEILI